MRVKVPRAFVEDHARRDLIERGLDACTVKVLKSGYVLDLTEAEFDELLDDARYYSGEGCRVFGFEMAGLISSARATVRAMEAVR